MILPGLATGLSSVTESNASVRAPAQQRAGALHDSIEMLDQQSCVGNGYPCFGNTSRAAVTSRTVGSFNDAETMVIETTETHISHPAQRAEQGVGFHPVASGCFLN